MQLRLPQDWRMEIKLNSKWLPVLAIYSAWLVYTNRILYKMCLENDYDAFMMLVQFCIFWGAPFTELFARITHSSEATGFTINARHEIAFMNGICTLTFAHTLVFVFLSKLVQVAYFRVLIPKN